MTTPASCQSFFVNQPQCFAQRIVHGNRRGVMICAIAAPIILNQSDVEIPALDLRAPRADAFESAFVERDRRQSRRRADTLLRARIADVNPLTIDSDRMPSKRRYGIHD